MRLVRHPVLLARHPVRLEHHQVRLESEPVQALPYLQQKSAMDAV